MAITFFGHASSVADNGTQDDTAARSITPPGSMSTGDIVVVGTLNRGTDTMSVATTGGQTWNAVGGNSDGSPNIHFFWCRFNGTWGADPAFRSALQLGSACIYWMLVFRPTSGSNTWAVDVAQAIGHTTSPASPFDSTVSAATAIATSTVTIALLGVADDKVCSLQTAGWANPGGATQIRNLAGNDATLVAAYKILTAPGTTGPVTIRQATAGITSQWRRITFREVAAAGPAITDVDTDEIVTSTQANVVLTGTNFGASQGVGSVKLIDGSISQTLSVDSWSDTSIQVDMSLGNCRYGSRTLRVTTNTLATADITITVNPPAGRTAITLGTLRANDFDLRNTPKRIYSVPDVTNTSQVEYGVSSGTGDLVVDLDGRVAWDTTVEQMTWRWHNGSEWSALYTWDLAGLRGTKVGVVNNLVLENGQAMPSVDFTTKFADEDTALALRTYALVGSVTGLSLTSGVLGGTPTVDGDTTLKVVMTDDTGLEVEHDSFTVRVRTAPTPPKFTGSFPDMVATVGIAIAAIEGATGFTGAATFTLSGAPLGISIDPLTGRMTGIPAVTGDFSPVITGVNAVGSTAAPAFAFKVNAIQVETTTVPRLTGLSAADAIALITAAQLSFGVRTDIETDDAIEGTVIGQVPAADAVVPLGAVVNISVALAPEVEPPEPPFIPPTVVPKSHRKGTLRNFLLG